MINGNTLILSETLSIIPEKAKPEFDDSGFVGVCTETEANVIPSTLAAPEISYKPDSAMSNGFIQLPRSLLEHPSVMDAPLAYFKILIYFVMNACYAPCKQDDNGKLVELQPGDFLFSERSFAKELGVTRMQVQRAIARFSHVKILSHKVSHRKSIISIKDPETYNLITNKVSQRSSQERAKSEPQKNKINKANKKNTHLRSYSPLAQEICVFFFDELKKHNPEMNIIADPEEAAFIDELLEKYAHEAIRAVIPPALSDEFWRGKILLPRNLVRGTKDNPNRFELLMGRFKGKINEATKKSANQYATPRRVGELVV